MTFAADDSKPVESADDITVKINVIDRTSAYPNTTLLSIPLSLLLRAATLKPKYPE